MTRLDRIVLGTNIPTRQEERIAARTRRMYLLLEKARRSADEGSPVQAEERYEQAAIIADRLGMHSMVETINRELDTNAVHELYRKASALKILY